MQGGIWIVGEIWGKNIDPVTFELLTKGRQLSEELGEELACIIIGPQVKGVEDELFRYGAKQVIVIEDELLSPFCETLYGEILAHYARDREPSIILAGATERAKAFMPICATCLETGLTANCMDLAIDPDSKALLQTRPAYGGNLMATIVCEDKRPQMATVRSGVFKAVPLDENVSGRVEELSIPDELRKNPFVVESFKPLEEAEDVPDYKGAEVVIAAGRGVAEPEQIKKLKELSQLLGGVLGATRPVTDMGLLPHHAQIGQTGQIVTPTLYMGFGISGAAPHTIGIQGTKIIVAINKDPDAPIFKFANYGIVANAEEIIDCLLEELRTQRGGQA